MKQILKNKFWVIAVLCLALGLSCSDAFARGHGGGGGRDGGDRHYYRDGRWYKHGWLGFDIAVSALTIGALIDSLPPRYETVVVGGVPYYCYDNSYYRPYPYGGYVVVQPPVVVTPEVAPAVVVAPAPVIAAPTAQLQAQIPETLIVNMPNSKGGYTSVTMKRSGNGFIGPQGEYYPGHPTVEQLKILYGK